MHTVNGYSFGGLIRAVPLSVAALTLAYAPVEVSAFALGGSAGLLAAMNAVAWCLRGRICYRWVNIAVVVMVSVMGIMLAGLLESAVIVVLVGRS